MKIKWLTATLSLTLVICALFAQVAPAAEKADSGGALKARRQTPAATQAVQAQPSVKQSPLSKAQVRAFVSCLEELMPLFKKYLSSFDSSKAIPLSGLSQWMTSKEVASEVPAILARHSLDYESFGRVHARVLAAYAELKAEAKTSPADPLESARVEAKLTPEQKKEMEQKLQERLENLPQNSDTSSSDLDAVKPFVSKLDAILGD